MRAVGRLPTLSRVAVRARFEERFTARRMAEDHVALYQRLLRGKAPLRLLEEEHVEIPVPVRCLKIVSAVGKASTPASATFPDVSIG